MNQTKKRLSIIKLAISITDIETIQLQILKLGLLRSDQKLQEIITALHAENYAQAQGLITTYIETPVDEIHQRSIQEDEAIQTDEEKAIIEEFDLFIEKDKTEKEPTQEIDDLHAFIDTTEEASKKISTEQIDYDTLLNVDADDILPNNIELDISQTPTDTFFDAPDTLDAPDEPKILKTEDTFFEPSKEEEKELLSDVSTKNEEITFQYTPISYITQKFSNMFSQYPPVETQDKTFESVNTFLNQISQKGYNDKDIEENIQYIQAYCLDKKAETAELLLLCAATESKYAQFQLARSLYRGTILKKNIPEAFSIMNSLSLNDSFPEAICDLGQFYEHGIGVEQSFDQAKHFYKEAMELNIERATVHYKRLSQSTSGLFSFFKK